MGLMHWCDDLDISEDFYFVGLYDDVEGFRVILRELAGERRSLRVSFDAVFSYRRTLEGFSLRSFDEKFTGWSFFTVTESDYLDWFVKESYEVLSPEDVKHYAIVTGEVVVHVLVDAECLPNVAFLN